MTNQKFSILFSIHLPLLVLLYFFPTYYTTSAIKNIKYFLLFLAILYVYPNIKKLKKNPIVWGSVVYLYYSFFISYYWNTSYAYWGNFFSFLLLFFFLLFVQCDLVSDIKTTILELYCVFLFFNLWDLFFFLKYPNGVSISSEGAAYYLFGNKNNHTFQLLSLLFLSFWHSQFLEKHKKTFLLVSSTLPLLIAILLNSSTTLTVIVIVYCFIVLYCLGFSFHLSAKLILLFSFIWNYILIFSKQEEWYSEIGSIYSKSATFSKRTLIWDKCFEEILDYPIFGHGNLNPEERIMILGGFNSHNQYLDSTFIGGIILLTILLCSLFVLANSIDRFRANQRCKTVLCIIYLGILTEMSFEQIAESHLFWFFIFLMYSFTSLDNSIPLQKNEDQ